MLLEQDIAKLCHGRIIKANVYQSSGGNAAGPHYLVMLDSDEAIKEHDNYYVAVISHNDEIDSKFIIPIPAKTGLTGFIVCSWLQEVALALPRSVRNLTLLTWWRFFGWSGKP